MNKYKFISELNKLIKEYKIDKITGYKSEFLTRRLWDYIEVFYTLEKGKIQK